MLCGGFSNRSLAVSGRPQTSVMKAWPKVEAKMTFAGSRGELDIA